MMDTVKKQIVLKRTGVLVEIDYRMVVAVGTLDRADADVIVRDMVWPACGTHHAKID